MATIYRSNFVQLIKRVSNSSVHNFMPSNFVVPLYVLNYLNKGAKFIPDHHRSHAGEVMRSLPRLQRQLTFAAHFQHDSSADKVSKCMVPSSWSPPRNAHIDLFMRLVSRDLLNYTPSIPRSNISWMDRKAQVWLRQHKDDVVIADLDTGI